MKSILHIAGAAAALALMTGTALAQFPERPVTLVVPFPPGGGTDAGARSLAQTLSEMWGQPVVVENRGGAAGSVGATYVANAEPDGYTIMMGNIGTQALNPLLHEGMTYDPQTDFEPISLVAELPQVLVVRPGLEDLQTPQDVIDWAMENPGAVTYSTSGVGTSMQLAAELFAYESGIELYHIPYAGGGPAVQDLVGGHVDISFPTVLEISGLIRDGTVRGLGVTSREATASLPDIEPIADTTIPDYYSVSWLGIVAPAGTPADIVEKISADIQEAVRTEALSERLLVQGATPVGSTAEEFAALIENDIARYSRLIEEAGITAE